jgi:hypothetical protein
VHGGRGNSGEDQGAIDTEQEGAAHEREIWQVTDVTEEDFETTEGESVDLCDKLMTMAGWTVRDHALT